MEYVETNRCIPQGYHLVSVFADIAFVKEHLLIAGYAKDVDKEKIAMPGFFANLRMVREMPKLGALPSSLALGTLGMPGYVHLIWLSTLGY